jgi:hypothetical protein
MRGKIGRILESTEQRIHAVAHLLPRSEDVHVRAKRLTERARRQFRRARALRRDS